MLHECGPSRMTGNLPTSPGLPALETCCAESAYCLSSAGSASPPTELAKGCLVAHQPSVCRWERDDPPWLGV